MEQAPIDFNNESPNNREEGQEETPAWKKWVVPVAASVALLLGLVAFIEARSAKDAAASAEQGATTQVAQEQRRLDKEVSKLQKDIETQTSKLRAQENKSQKNLQAEIQKEINKTNQAGAKAERVQRQSIAEVEKEIDSLDRRVQRLENQVRSLQDSANRE
jgi:septal ring factor EnvC (AmiA/AmiB activator)